MPQALGFNNRSRCKHCWVLFRGANEKQVYCSKVCYEADLIVECGGYNEEPPKGEDEN